MNRPKPPPVNLDKYCEGRSRNYVSYEDGARMYGMTYWGFVRLCQEIGANIPLRKTSIVDTEIVEAYIEEHTLEMVEEKENENISANMLRSKFYVCPVCGNVIHSMGEAAIHCHGIQLTPLEAEPADEHHMAVIERIEDEHYVRIDHSMTKEHYISFAAAASSDDIQIVKLYPEGSAEARFKIRGVRRILFYCNRDGLFMIDPIRGIDDKESK